MPKHIMHINEQRWVDLNNAVPCVPSLLQQAHATCTDELHQPSIDHVNAPTEPLASNFCFADLLLLIGPPFAPATSMITPCACNLTSQLVLLLHSHTQSKEVGHHDGV